MDVEEVRAGTWEVSLYHVDDFGNQTHLDDSQLRTLPEGSSLVHDDYQCANCGAALSWWADVVDHVDDFKDDDDGGVGDGDSLVWGRRFGFGSI